MKTLAVTSFLALGSSLLLTGSAEAARHGRAPKGKVLVAGGDMHLPGAARPTAAAARVTASPRVSQAHSAPRGVTVYLNRNGATLTAGDDDSAHGVSGMLEEGATLAVPAWRGGERAWNQVAACVQDHYNQFNIDIVTTRPTSGQYIMAMVGGTSAMFGYQDDVSGVALSDQRVNRAGIVFAFAETVDNDADAACLTVVHEVGHALGLDHAYRCGDPMSYLWNCDSKQFEDVEAPCGEESARTCESGKATQNSYRILARAVGLRDAATVMPPAAPGPLAPDDTADDTADDTDSEDVDSDDDEPAAPEVVDLTGATAAQLAELAHEAGFQSFAALMQYVDAHPQEVDVQIEIGDETHPMAPGQVPLQTTSDTTDEAAAPPCHGDRHGGRTHGS